MARTISLLLLALVFLTSSVTASLTANQFGDQNTKTMVGKECIGRSGLTGVWVVVCADRKPPVKPGTCAQTTVVCRVKSYGPAPTPKTHN
jgi:hypothetical protein